MKKALSFIILVLLSSTGFSQVQPLNSHRGEVDPAGTVFFRAEPLNNTRLKGGPDEMIMYVHLQGDKITTGTKQRLPLNLSVVIDKSGSMGGDKIDYTRKAVQYLIDQLSAEDRLSIVVYDTDVKVLFEPILATRKEFLKERVQTIGADGTTNLEGGMKKGFELVKQVKKQVGNTMEMVNRVILLSDGLANVGVTDPNALSRISNNYFNEYGISISTFGVGADYNEDLMSKIAGQGGGRYYFISSPDQLPKLFSEELQGISSAVAKNTVLTVYYPQDLMAMDHVYMYSYKNENGKLTINFNDVFADEQKAIIIRFRSKSSGKDATFNINLRYSKADSSLKEISQDKYFTVSETSDKTVYEKNFNKAASEGYALHVSGEEFNDAVQHANNRRFTESKKAIRNAETILENHFKLFGEHPFLKEIYNDMKDYEQVIKDLENMKDQTQFNLNIKKHKYRSFNSRSRSKF